MLVIQKMLLKNIDQEIELILIKQKQYNLDSFAQGYHVYMDIWTPKVGNEKLFLKSDNENHMTSLQLLLCWKNE